jgi:hypothetical protein
VTVHLGGRFFIVRAVERTDTKYMESEHTVTHRIGIIGGDGIGPEVVAEAVKVIDAAGVQYEAVPFDLGGGRYLRDGAILPDEDLAAIAELDAWERDRYAAEILGALNSAAGPRSS